MTQRFALIMLHQGSLTVAALANACRMVGLEPVAMTNANAAAAEPFVAKCKQQNIECHVFDEMSLDLKDALQVMGTRTAEFALCLAVWDGQRPLMAAVNRHLGVPDASPEGVALVQDKFEFRHLMVKHGLSRLRCLKATSPQVRDLMRDAPGPWIIKPRRGVGSLCTNLLRNHAELQTALAAFAHGTSSSDMFAELFRDNELIVEDYFDGLEFSLEILLRDGQCVFYCEHEKTQLTFTGQTVLENGLASPATRLSAAQVRKGLERALQGLRICGLDQGWYHVELRANAAGDTEFIEINARIGGGLIGESISRQFSFNPLEQWLRMFVGTAADPGDVRRCGTYQQLSFPSQQEPLLALDRALGVRSPDVIREMKKPGDVCRVDREDIAAMVLWETGLTGHAAEVRRLAAQDYLTVRHEAPGAGRLGAARQAS